MYVENLQEFIGDYLSRIEIAPENLYLTNRDLGVTPSGFIQSSVTNRYKAKFEAREKIFVGKTTMNGNNIYSNNPLQDYLTPNDEFKVSHGAFAKIHAGDEIELLPGTTIELGSEAEIFIEPFNCANNLRTMIVSSNSSNVINNETANQLPVNNFINKRQNEPLSDYGQINFYSNPNNGNFVVENNTKNALATIEIVDLTGKVVYSTQTNNSKSEINIGNIQNGIYIIRSYNQHTNTYSKIIISK
jgi:Secretion system C-terminal sorting domain